VAWDDRLPARRALDDGQRFAILRRLLHEREIDLRDRFSGSVLLLYGKPVTRIAALRTTAICVAPDGVTTLRLGRGAIPLPEPLGAIALSLSGISSSSEPVRRAGCCRAVMRASTSARTRCADV
jgi:hypothetical protein